MQKSYKYKVVDNGYPIIYVKEFYNVMSDGVKISETIPHRYTLVPTDDISNQPSEIRDFAAPLFTQEAKDAYNQAISRG